jgi:clan AA aspartic protease (TIGR02281 family)
MILRVLVVLGLLPMTVSAAVWIGLGLNRQLPAWQVAAVSLLFTTLPVSGIWAILGRTRGALAAGAWSWPVLSFLLLPGFFPGEYSSALGTGLATLVAGAGPEWVDRAGRAGEQFAPMTVESGTPPAPEAKVLTPECPSSVPNRGNDEVALPYEGQGHSLAIPVQFGDTDLSMLFDTGATVTTLDSGTLAKLGVKIPSDAPELKLRTANGERTARLVLVPEVWIGGMRVAPVTVGVCEECADQRVSGLLGLNVSGLFLVTLDTVRKEVVFQQRPGQADRVVDISPWLELSALATIFPDNRVEVEISGTNKSERSISQAEAGIHCGDQHFAGVLENISAGDTVKTKVRLPRGADCSGYTVTLEHAHW